MASDGFVARLRIFLSPRREINDHSLIVFVERYIESLWVFYYNNLSFSADLQCRANSDAYEVDTKFQVKEMVNSNLSAVTFLKI